MNRVIIVARIVTVVTITGCGGGVEHESYEPPHFSGQRTRIHVKSHGDQSTSYRFVDGQSINLHVHTSGGQSACIEITTGR